MESTQKRKRGSSSILHGAIHDIEDGQIDEAYAKYLHNLKGSWEPDFAEENEGDPTYMMFLTNLKACGNAYMLDVSRKHGVSFPIRYEVENDPTVELSRKTPRSCVSALIREIASLCVVDDVVSGQENSASLNDNAQRDTLTKKRRRSNSNHELNLGLKNSGLVKENVPRRSPRIVENSSNARKKDELRLDVNGDLLSGSKHLGSNKENTQSRTLVKKRRSSAVDCQLNSSLGNSGFGKRNTSRHIPRVVQNSLHALEKRPSGKLRQEVDCHRSSEQGRMSNSKADIVVDELYRNFISGLKVVGDSVFYEYGDGKRVYYEGNDQQRSSNVEVEPQDIASAPLSMTPRPRTPSPRRPTPPPRLLTPPPRAQTAEGDSHMLRTSTKKVTKNWKAFPSSDSWFWKAVEKDLRRPFEQKEYEDLLEKANARKPIGVHRETRRGGYKMEFLSKMGKSYLDSYPDLNLEIEKAKSDPYKVVNLLRGFFFYLKKLPHGVPKPWKNEYCKTIMPGPRCS